MKNKLYWLAGLLDGEGHFGISVTRSRSDNYDFRPMIIIEMIEGQWLKEVKKIYNTFNIKYQYFERYTKSNRLGCKIFVGESKSLKKLCELLHNKLILKNKQNTVLYKFEYGRAVKTCNRYKLKWIDWEILNNKINSLDSLRKLNHTNNEYVHTIDDIKKYYKQMETNLPKNIKGV